jgi:hypothetical protein
MLNEPSAAGIEYAYRHRRQDLTSAREHLVVYDLGGGTFDVSVIRITGQRHEVIASEGISRLGGDDFDELLMGVALSQPTLPHALQKRFALAASGIVVAPLTSGFRSRLLHLCREAKESINPNTRKITVDFGQISPDADAVLVPISQFHDKCRPLISKTIQLTESVLESVLQESGPEFKTLPCVYLVGGSCDLPILARSLKEHFGKRVQRSPYPSAATAVGLAVTADHESGYTLEERFSRFFGVWRESDDGSKITFDPIFVKGTVLPRPGQPPIVAIRRYHPVHNIGHFRFLECSNLKSPQLEPGGDIISWEEIFFPFNPSLQGDTRLEMVPVKHWREAGSFWIEEVYRCDAEGIIQVTISNQAANYVKTFRIR